MKWFRLYHELLDDPKVQRLEPGLFKFWINFLCLANRSEDRGVVNLEPEAIAFALRISDDEARTSLDALARLGLIEPVETGLKPHNWDDRQRKSDDVTARVTANRRAKQEGETLQATLHETLHARSKQQNGNVPSSARTRAPEKELEREENDGAPSEHGASAGSPVAIQPPTNPTDGDVYALVDAWAIATDRKPTELQGRLRKEAFDALKPLVNSATKDDVANCVRFFRSGEFFSTPGRLTVFKLADALPQWIAQGRPATEPPRLPTSPPPRLPRSRDIGLTNDQLDELIARGVS